MPAGSRGNGRVDAARRSPRSEQDAARRGGTGSLAMSLRNERALGTVIAVLVSAEIVLGLVAEVLHAW